MIFSGPGFTGGFVAGFAAGFCTREISRFVIKVSKPVAKSASKFGEEIFEKGRETVAHMGETLEDLVAEMKVGLKTQPAAATGESSKTTSKSTARKKAKNLDE